MSINLIMTDNILTICLGNNTMQSIGDNLKGSRNDAILFYNYILINQIEKKKNSKFLKPKILLNESVTLDNILTIIKKYILKINRLIIFYSGHGYKNGYFNIPDKNKKLVNKKKLLDNINSSINKELQINFIFDSCYAGIAFRSDRYSMIKEIKMISSTSENQKANETICNYEKLIKEKKLKFLLSKLNLRKNNMSIGIFTFNFINILYRDRLKIDNWNEFLNDKFWKQLLKAINQYPKTKW